MPTAPGEVGDVGDRGGSATATLAAPPERVPASAATPPGIGDDPRPGQGLVPLPYSVAQTRAETADTVTLYLNPCRAAIDPPRPGQFAMLAVPGVGEVPISFSGVPDRPSGQLEHTVRAVGAVTRALAERRPGDTVGVRGPYGRGWDLRAATGRHVVVVAGGIGLAPLRPVVAHLLRHRDQVGELRVAVGTRTPDALLYAAEVHAWRSRFDMSVEVTVDAGERTWHGHVGLVTEVLPRELTDAAHTTAYVCGPEVMMRMVARRLVALGIPPGAIQISLERAMQCGVGQCGHCQYGPLMVCRDGPVVSYAEAAPLLAVREL